MSDNMMKTFASMMAGLSLTKNPRAILHPANPSCYCAPLVCNSSRDYSQPPFTQLDHRWPPTDHDDSPEEPNQMDCDDTDIKFKDCDNEVKGSDRENSAGDMSEDERP
ncbi:hypothetical protein PAXRUDRAFT_19176 [Paxillus rubicundulus Ve08.2h10]|uniref:Uncharacterized protein n=1 Tax=Paxillus rubicundulus Ve08.2h10 TaxID=930991 RepID=A0A0D0CJ52_9AGAM|nr:hypothetical protein PAXRUDRAFT_19176 [Paxillus rubicundulus Ve08.2h10]